MSEVPDMFSSDSVQAYIPVMQHGLHASMEHVFKTLTMLYLISQWPLLAQSARLV